MNLLDFFAKADIALCGESTSATSTSSSGGVEVDVGGGLPETEVTGFNQWQNFNNWS